jgi:hypothetical protein
VFCTDAGTLLINPLHLFPVHGVSDTQIAVTVPVPAGYEMLASKGLLRSKCTQSLRELPNACHIVAGTQ